MESSQKADDQVEDDLNLLWFQENMAFENGTQAPDRTDRATTHQCIHANSVARGNAAQAEAVAFRESGLQAEVRVQSWACANRYILEVHCVTVTQIALPFKS